MPIPGEATSSGGPGEGSQGRGGAALLWRVRPQFDPRARIVYGLIATIIALKLLLFDGLGFEVGYANPWDLDYLAVFAILVAGMFRRVGHERGPAAVEMVALLLLSGLPAVFLQFPLMLIGPDGADERLLAADRLLGFDWLSFARLFIDPLPYALIKTAYSWLHTEAIAVLAILAMLGRITRGWQVITSAILALLICLLVCPLFPAQGEYVLCGLRPQDVPVVENLCRFGEAISAVRVEGLRVIDQTMRIGLLSFPSFHAASAVILAWGLWGIRWLRWPSVALNILMTIGAIVVGAHYFVDILGGILVGGAAVLLARRFISDDSAGAGSSPDEESASEGTDRGPPAFTTSKAGHL